MTTARTIDAASTGTWIPAAEGSAAAEYPAGVGFTIVPAYSQLAPWLQVMGSEQIPVSLPLGESSASGQVVIVLWTAETREYEPRSDLGRKLVALRRRAIASGMRLMSWDEINEEIERRRGEHRDGEDTDLY